MGTASLSQKLEQQASVKNGNSKPQSKMGTASLSQNNHKGNSVAEKTLISLRKKVAADTSFCRPSYADLYDCLKLSLLMPFLDFNRRIDCFGIISSNSTIVPADRETLKIMLFLRTTPLENAVDVIGLTL